jgi:hypothetical protein
MFQGLVSETGGPSGASGQAAKAIAVPSIASSPSSSTIALVAIPARPAIALDSFHLPIIRQDLAFVDIVLFEAVLVLMLSLILGGVARHRPS